MLETPQYVYEIQDALLNPDVVDWDLLESAAAQYAEACRAVNDRLRAISPLLKQHLYGQAVQEALSEPALENATNGNIQEWAEELDFPGLQAWRDLLSSHGRSRPPELQLDIAQQINAAIGHSQSHQLSRLERRHRLLPLAGAPLQQRINTLRRLHELQKENTTWIRQLELLEKARHSEFPNELREAVAANDLELVDQLCEQLQSSEWRVPPEPGMVTRARKIKQTLADQGALLQLEKIVDLLCKAQMECDVDQLRQARKGYHQLLSKIKATPPHELTARAQEPLEWLNQEDASDDEQKVDELINGVLPLVTTDPAAALKLCQQARTRLEESANLSQEIRTELADRIDDFVQQAEGILGAREKFDAACGNLETAIYRDAEADRLKPLYTALLSFDGCEVPVELASRYRKAVHDQTTATRTKRRYRRLVILGIVALIVVGTVFAASEFTTRQRAQLAAAQLEPLLRAKKLPEARRLVDNLSIATRQHQSLVPLVQRLEDAEQAEQSRQDKFEETLVLIETGDLADADPERLADAKRLAFTIPEITRLAKLRIQVDEAVNKRATEQKRELTTTLDNCDNQLTGLSDKEGQLSTAEERQLGQFVKELQDIVVLQEATHPLIAARAQEMILDAQELLDSATSKREKVAMLIRENEAETRITGGIGNADPYKAALRAFVTDFPTSQFRQPYETILADTNLWRGITSVANWKQVHDGPNKSAPPANFAALHGTSPFDLMADQRDKYARAIIARSQNDLIENLTLFFEIQLIGEFWMVQTKAGVRYYHDQPLVLDKLTKKNGNLLVPHRPNSQFDDQDEPVEAPLAEADIEYCGRAPQSKLATEFLKQFQQINNKNWEKTMLEIVSAVRNEKGLDPVLKLIVLRKLVQVTSEGSYPFQQAFKPVAEAIANSEKRVIAGIDWVRPTDAKVQVAREQAAAVLKGLEDFNVLQQKAGTLWSKLKKRIDTDYNWLGRVSLAGDGDWIVLWRDPNPPLNGKLFILQNNLKDIRLHPVGSVTNGNVTFLPTQKRLLLAGSPIYVHIATPRE